MIVYEMKSLIADSLITPLIKTIFLIISIIAIRKPNNYNENFLVYVKFQTYILILFLNHILVYMYSFKCLTAFQGSEELVLLAIHSLIFDFCLWQVAITTFEFFLVSASIFLNDHFIYYISFWYFL